MKKLFTFLLVFSLAFSPIWCLGEREVGLKTIFFGETSETQQIPSSEKLSNPLQTQKISVQNSTESMTSQGNSNLVTMSTDEIVDEIIATSADAKEVNGELIKSLVVVKATNVMLSTQVNNMEEYTNELETDLDTKTTDLINSNLKIEGLKGDVDTLKEKVKNNKSFNFALVGVDYNTVDGYGVTFDVGSKFAWGLMTSVGVSAPIDIINPVNAMDLSSYTFNTKIGFAW